MFCATKFWLRCGGIMSKKVFKWIENKEETHDYCLDTGWQIGHLLGVDFDTFEWKLGTLDFVAVVVDRGFGYLSECKKTRW